MPIPDVIYTLWTSGQYLGSEFAGGVMGNLVASVVVGVTKLVTKPIRDRMPDIAKLLQNGGHEQSHDLLRTLRRAECAVMVTLCDQVLLDDFDIRKGSGSILDRLQARLKHSLQRGREPEDERSVAALCRIRRVFAETYAALGEMPDEDVKALGGVQAREIPALIRAGTECLDVDDLASLRSRVAQEQIAALERMASAPGADGAPFIPGGLPSGLRTRLRLEHQGWCELLAFAFREELKDDKNIRARRAWEMDVLSLVPESLGHSFEEFTTRFAKLDEAVKGSWDEVKKFRVELGTAIDTLHELTLEVLHEVAALHAELAGFREEYRIDAAVVRRFGSRFDRIEELLRSEAVDDVVLALRPAPRMALPPNVMHNDAFTGRVDELIRLHTLCGARQLQKQEEAGACWPAWGSWGLHCSSPG